MDKIFGEVDAVEAGETEGTVNKVEALVYSHVEGQDEKRAERRHVVHDGGSQDN